jgi:hypothetical protein
MMSNSIKNDGYYFAKKCVLALFLLTTTIQTEQDFFYFDSFPPVTWYEKALNATMYAWHTIGCMVDARNQTCGEIVPFDVVMGRLFFAYYCIGKIEQTKEHVMGEDISYLFSILDRLKNLIVSVPREYGDSDHNECVLFIVDTMQKSLYPNSMTP